MTTDRTDRNLFCVAVVRLLVGLSMAWIALPAYAADAGIATIVDGPSRVLRGSVWYRLAPGASVQDGDVIDAGDRALVQLELTGGGTLHLVGPGALYIAALPWRNDKLEGPMEFALERGWLKLVAPVGVVTRVRTSPALITITDATIVTRADAKTFELFTESGSAKLTESTRSGRDGTVHDVRPGEYWARESDKPFATEKRAPVKFVASMPRHLTDRLVQLAPRFKGQRAGLTVEREITLAEADPWLAGPYRRAFARRLGGRLADPAFRKAVEGNLAAYPDFDRVLHPEKFPGQPGAPGAPTASPAGAVPAPAAGGAKPAPAATTPLPGSAAPKAGPRSALPFLLSEISISRSGKRP